MSGEQPIYVPFFPYTSLGLIGPITSTIACTFVLIICLLNRLHKETVVGWMAAWILGADILFSFPKIIDYFMPSSTTFWCRFTEAIVLFGVQSSFIWSAFFGHLLYVVSTNSRVDELSRFKKAYILFAVFLPAISAISMTFTPYVMIDPDTKLCAHPVYQGHVDFLYLFLMSIPLMTCCLLSIIWYVLAGIQLRKHLDRGSTIELLVLVLYPGILLVCWVPNLVLNMYIFIGGHEVPNKTIMVGFVTLGHMQGFLDAIVYVKARMVVRGLKRLCPKRHEEKERESGSYFRAESEDELQTTLKNRKPTVVKNYLYMSNQSSVIA